MNILISLIFVSSSFAKSSTQSISLFVEDVVWAPTISNTAGCPSTNPIDPPHTSKPSPPVVTRVLSLNINNEVTRMRGAINENEKCSMKQVNETHIDVSCDEDVMNYTTCETYTSSPSTVDFNDLNIHYNEHANCENHKFIALSNEDRRLSTDTTSPFVRRRFTITTYKLCWKKSQIVIGFLNTYISLQLPSICRDCKTTGTRKRLIAKHGTSRYCSGQTCTCYDGTLTCTGCSRRYPWQQLSQVNKAEFMNTLNDVALDHYTDYYTLLLKHGTESGIAHFGPWFALWHHRYLYEFEQLLQRINKCVTLPYIPEWLDSDPSDTEWSIWDNVIMGQPDTTSSIAFGMYDTSAVSMPSSFSRSYCRGSSFNYNNVYTWLDVTNLLSMTSFTSFANSLEGMIHTYYHNSVGSGSCAVGGFNEAPFDPTFFMHHAYVDRIFCMWKAAHPTEWTAYLATQATTTLSSDWGTWIDTENLLSSCGCRYNSIYIIVPFDPPILFINPELVLLEKGIALPSEKEVTNSQVFHKCIRSVQLTEQQQAWKENLPLDLQSDFLNSICKTQSFRDNMRIENKTTVTLLLNDIDLRKFDDTIDVRLLLQSKQVKRLQVPIEESILKELQINNKNIHNNGAFLPWHRSHTTCDTSQPRTSIN